MTFTHCPCTTFCMHIDLVNMFGALLGFRAKPCMPWSALASKQQITACTPLEKGAPCWLSILHQRCSEHRRHTVSSTDSTRQWTSPMQVPTHMPHMCPPPLLHHVADASEPRKCHPATLRNKQPKRQLGRHPFSQQRA